MATTTDATQLAARIKEERDLATALIGLLNECRGAVKRWETGAYGNSLTDAQVAEAGYDTRTAEQVQNGINAFAGFVALSDSTWGNVLENISS